MYRGFTPPLAAIGDAVTTAGLDSILSLPAFEGMSRATLDELLAEFGRFVAAEIAPLNSPGDREGSVLNPEGRVKTPTGFAAAYRRYVDAGWSAASFDPAIGGGGLPKLAATAMEELLTAANMAFSL